MTSATEEHYICKAHGRPYLCHKCSAGYELGDMAAYWKVSKEEFEKAIESEERP